MRASPAGLQHAEQQARLLGAELNLGKFEWFNWGGSDSESESGSLTGEWLKKFEADYWNRRSRDSQTLNTWRTDYQSIFNKLPKDQMLSPELLLHVINDIPPDSRQRKRAVQTLVALAKFAGLQADFSTLIGSYSPSRVNPRFLPSDEAIAAAVIDYE